MKQKTDTATLGTLSRRTFVKAGSALAASAAALGALGCSPDASVMEEEKKEEVPEQVLSETGETHPKPTNNEAGGTWVNAACWHNCGGRCVNKVMVKDGMVVRQKTDDSHEDSPEFPQQRGCVRGKAQQQQCFGADRLLYPMKRKNWEPGGVNVNGDLRGKDEWERISWDEAIEMTASELQRIIAEYGNEGIYAGWAGSSITPFVCAIGGAVNSWETSSMGTYQFGAHMYGLPFFGLGNANDRFDMENADYIVMWSSNPVWSAAGTPINNYINAREAGAKFISVDPIYNASAHMLDAEWVPVLTGTDMAYMLGVAYEMLRLDEEKGNIIDWDFLHTYTVGFDAESMPEDAKIDENLRGYLMGDYDGTPKTAEWASLRCGVPIEQVTKMAEILAKDNDVMILHNYAFSRCHGADQVGQMLMTLAAMGGHIGKPGNCYGSSYHADCGNAGAPLVTAGAATGSTLTNPVTAISRVTEILPAIANGGGKVINAGNPAMGAPAAPQEIELGPVKCIIHEQEAALQTSLYQKMGIAAHRAVDFVLTNAQFMTTNARYSDIVLPVTTEWERVGGVVGSNREFLYTYSQVTKPLGETKTDKEIYSLVLEKMGIDPAIAYPVSDEQAYYQQIAGSMVLGNGGEMVPLVTLTADDIKKLGGDGEPQQGIISLEEFQANGYQYKRSKGDGLGYIGYEAFIKDPVANPLMTASGKFEIYCQAFNDTMNMLGFPNVDAYKPYPVYIEPPKNDGYAATFENHDIEGGVKSEYPYLLYNPHYMRRSHSVFDNCPWLRETWPNPVFLAREDAEREGIKEGDAVLITTYAGQGVRTAALMENMRPGVVGVPHGAWVNVDEATGIDMAGSDNYLIGPDYSGFGVSGYNNCTCRIEKYSGSIPADCDVPARLVAGVTAQAPAN